MKNEILEMLLAGMNETASEEMLEKVVSIIGKPLHHETCEQYTMYGSCSTLLVCNAVSPLQAAQIACLDDINPDLVPEIVQGMKVTGEHIESGTTYVQATLAESGRKVSARVTKFLSGEEGAYIVELF